MIDVISVIFLEYALKKQLKFQVKYEVRGFPINNISFRFKNTKILKHKIKSYEHKNETLNNDVPPIFRLGSMVCHNGNVPHSNPEI
jgi:hypothetical protein